MSLFQLREWWATRAGTNEEFHVGSLCIGNVDNDTSAQYNADKIVVGSFRGIIRMYYPRRNEFKIEDLLMEEQLEFPILQLALGKFLPGSKQNALAVLHPRSVVVYMVESVGGNGASASYFRLVKTYSHLLGVDGEHFTAYNMTYGPFGNAYGKDHLCVQSLDGRLQFFEQDTYAFVQQFNSCLVPGTLCYIPQTDSFVTSTSDLSVECYKYQVLASSMCTKKKNQDGDEEEKTSFTQQRSKTLTSTKKLQTDWKTNIGENILDIRVGRISRSLTSAQFDILVLGSFTLYCLKSKGDVRSQKRLGFHPAALCLYTRPDATDEGSAENLLIASHDKQVMVYHDAQLTWSAMALSVPVDLKVSMFGNIPGMIVSLNEEGSLAVNYLGTDPPTTVVGTNEVKELNYEAMDAEHRELLNVIRQSQGGSRKEPRERILLRAQVPSLLDSMGRVVDEFIPGTGYARNEQGNIVQITLRIFVNYTGKGKMENVTLSLNLPENLKTRRASILIPSVDGSSTTPLIIPVTLYPCLVSIPREMNISIAAAYTLESGQPRTTIVHVALPLIMACVLVPPVKMSKFKFTIDTNQDPPHLPNIFQDMLTQPESTPEWVAQVITQGANVLSFRYYNGIDVTIVASKNGGRYRIQSNVLEALYLIAVELVQRLEKFHSPSGKGALEPSSSPLKITYEEPLPLADFFEAIDHHHQIRKKQADLYAEINDRSHQFRVIQKRLLARFKDRTPAPLNQLDTIMRGTYDQLITLAQEMEKTQSYLQLAGNRLSCAVSLILFLMRFRFHLTDANFQVLKAHLSPEVIENADVGWEEVADASLTQLLRTVLAKSSGGSFDVGGTTEELKLPDDTKKLKKHITIVCDRLAKGASLVNESSGKKEKLTTSSEPSKEEDKLEQERRRHEEEEGGDKKQEDKQEIEDA